MGTILGTVLDVIFEPRIRRGSRSKFLVGEWPADPSYRLIVQWAMRREGLCDAGLCLDAPDDGGRATIARKTGSLPPGSRVSPDMTERYLGGEQGLRHVLNDAIGLSTPDRRPLPDFGQRSLASPRVGR